MELRLVVNIERYFSLLRENGSRLVFEHGDEYFLDLSRNFFPGVLYRNMISHDLFNDRDSRSLISLNDFVRRESISNYLNNVRGIQSDLRLRSDEFVEDVRSILSELEFVDETVFSNTSRTLLGELFYRTFIIDEFENNHIYLHSRLESRNLTSDLIELYNEFHSAIQSLETELHSLSVNI